MKPEDLTWEITPSARKTAAKLRAEMTAEEYQNSKRGLQCLICGYLALGDLSQRMGSTICPIGGGGNGEHWFKVRWSLPGRGKSRSLRLAIAVSMSDRIVRIAFIARRGEDPKIEEITAALEEAD